MDVVDRELPLDERWAVVWPHRPQLIGLAMRYCTSASEAEELVDDAILRVVLHPDLDVARVGGLLRRVTVNRCIDARRRDSRWQRLRHRLAAHESHASMVDVVEGPAVARSTGAWVHSRMHAMPATERAVLEQIAQGATIRQAADDLGISYKAADSALTRARSRLRPMVTALAVLGASVRVTRQALRPAPLLFTSAVTVAVLGAALSPTPGPSVTPAQPLEAAVAIGSEAMVDAPSATTVSEATGSPAAPPALTPDEDGPAGPPAAEPAAEPRPAASEVVFDSSDVTPDPGPAGGLVDPGGVVVTEHEGRAEDGDIVGEVLACVEVLEVGPHEAGCPPEDG